MNTFTPVTVAAVVFSVLIAWSSAAHGAILEKLVMPGPLSESHAEFEDDCANCHSPLDDVAQLTLCVACHTEVGDDMAASRGFHGRNLTVAENECQQCHTEHEGRAAKTLEFDAAHFDHAATDFPLLWAHGLVACEGCHQESARYRDTPDTCVGCHRADDPHKAALGKMCGDCHNQREWQTTSFDHAQTRFPLTGAHETAGCVACHENNAFDNTPTACSSCHGADDVHDGGFGAQCSQCHSTSTWAGTLFDHLSTGFALDGGHSALSCQDCHEASPTGGLQGNSCGSCHADDDVHKGLNGAACGSCHVTGNWVTSKFDHLRMGGFALRGAHSVLACDACHQGSLANAVPTSCGACHIDDDPHQGQQGSACESCHAEQSWLSDIRFVHELTAFPLIGSHAALECSACHDSLAFHSVALECNGCHAAEDQHRGSLGSDCQQCHNPAGWQATTFDHTAQAGFALSGAHVRIECASCHGKAVFLQATSPQECVQCHRQDDPHQSRFGSDCERCHGDQSFTRIERF